MEGKTTVFALSLPPFPERAHAPVVRRVDNSISLDRGYLLDNDLLGG